MNILEKIVKNKWEELSYRKSQISLSLLKEKTANLKPRYSLKEALLNPSGSKIIAEFKRESPSKGTIHLDAPLDKIIQGYVRSGAAALSVLTEEAFFKGSDQDFKEARKLCTLPMLRKDFMIDEYQFYEAKSMGADAVLLIASILSRSEVEKFTHLAHDLDLEVLLEVHSLEELKNSYFDEIDLVGVNNRDLTSFKVDMETSIQLSSHIPSHSIKISESGISDPKRVIQLMEWGFKGFLIGEIFMKEADPEIALRNFIGELNTLKRNNTLN